MYSLTCSNLNSYTVSLGATSVGSDAVCRRVFRLWELGMSHCVITMTKTLTSSLMEVGCTRNWRWALVNYACISVMSLIYRRKSKGPSTDPCGTPNKTGLSWEASPPTTTRIKLNQKLSSDQKTWNIPHPDSRILSQSCISYSQQGGNSWLIFLAGSPTAVQKSDHFHPDVMWAESECAFQEVC